ncbi:SET domain-containing protein [Athelia psychrophila]|uniref:SET domain-containing protein n=1 Tax=Athelia psychrophila TaxID=1759441 RepID=A0A166EJY4_9AGAM|nr:SET domain-containing protein [Fibularhizoctonia sp. CBS 109695]
MSTPKPYIIQPIPGKGMGVLATRSIKYGELILSESPLFTQSHTVAASTIQAALAPKSDADKRKYLELSNCHAEMPPLHGIYETNAFPCGATDTGNAVAKGGIFLEGSRFNSSCRQNVNNCWNARKEVIEFRAVRDIEEGEELCVTYAEDCKTREVRRKTLRQKFHFECQCPVCALSGADLKASDERRVMIGKLEDEIGQCVGRPAEGMKKIKQAVRLAREEGLVLPVLGFSYDAFQFCVMTSDLKNAKAWISQTSKLATCIRGPEAALVYEEYVKNPKTQRGWGFGRRMTLEGPE